MADLVFRDETEVELFKLEHDSIVRAHRSLNEDRIMAENATIRSEGLARDLTFGRPLLRMSLAQLEALQRRFPVLKHGTSLERSRMWKLIARDPSFRKLWVKD